MALFPEIVLLLKRKNVSFVVILNFFWFSLSLLADLVPLFSIGDCLDVNNVT